MAFKFGGLSAYEVSPTRRASARKCAAKRDSLPRKRERVKKERGALPLPLAGEGWGGGASTDIHRRTP